jgi:hypothetical protein
MKKGVLASLSVLMILSSALIAYADDKIGPLNTITPQQFLKLPQDYQFMYVAGYIDSATFISYGYSFPDHADLVACCRSMSLEIFAKEVVSWLKRNPQFEEGMASAVAHTTGEIYKQKTIK